MDLKNSVLIFIRRKKLIPPGSRVLLGVSGGADSLVMAHIINALRNELSLSLTIAHYNHRLRKSADTDQKCVEEFAKNFNVPLIVGKQAKSHIGKKISEDKARQWRLQFFCKAVARYKSEIVCLAHNRNDVAETVLMRILRGSGLYGLKSIWAHREIEGMVIARPLLECTRQEIEDYAAQHKLRFCTDETNDQTDFLRNRLRHTLLPLLMKEYNQQITGALVDLSETAGEDYDFLEQQMKQSIKENLVSLPGTVKIKDIFIRRQHPAMRRMLLRHAFECLTGDYKHLTFAHIGEVEDLVAQRPTGSVVNWPSNVRVIKTQGFIEFNV